MKTITFNGQEITFDDDKLTDWKIQRAMTNSHDLEGIFNACDEVLCGKADEVAEALGGKMDTMTDLMKAIAESAGDEAKNSPSSRQQFKQVASK